MKVQEQIGSAEWQIRQRYLNNSATPQVGSMDEVRQFHPNFDSQFQKDGRA